VVEVDKKKGEVTSQKRDERDIVKVLIVGFLLALLIPLLFVIIMVVTWTPPKPPSCPEGTKCVVMASSQICTSKYLFLGLLPTVYLAYFILGLLLYIVSLAFGAKTKAKIRFWAKSFFAGAIIGALLVVFASNIMLTLIKEIFIRIRPEIATEFC
jgi:hypothetical protein